MRVLKIAVACVLILAIVVLANILGCNGYFSYILSERRIIAQFNTNRQAFENAKEYLAHDAGTDRVCRDSYDQEEECLRILFGELGYVCIYKPDTYVYYYRLMGLQSAVGVAFSTTGKEPWGPYVTRVTRIDHQWFFFRMK